MGLRGIFKLVLGLFILFHSTVQAEQTCAVTFSDVQKFHHGFHHYFSKYPDLFQTLAHFKDKESLLKEGRLSLLSALETSYQNILKASSLEASEKQKLQTALMLALAELRRDAMRMDFGGGSGGFGGGSGGGSGGGGSGASGTGSEMSPEEIDQYIKTAAFRKCVTNTAMLVGVSEVVTVAGALQMKWDEYAGGAGAVSGLLRKETWKSAAADPDFVHNAAWNIFLMAALGAGECISNRAAGEGLVTVSSALMSMGSQYLLKGEIDIRQVVVDTWFIRYISIPKYKLFSNAAEKYFRSGRPAPRLAQAALFTLSESIGAILYPRVNKYSKPVWDALVQRMSQILERDSLFVPSPSAD